MVGVREICFEGFFGVIVGVVKCCGKGVGVVEEI